MSKPRVYADFHNADSAGRLRLNSVGTLEDLASQQVELQEGMVLTLYADDLDAQGEPDELLVDGTVAYSPEERCWVAAVDWSRVRHASELRNTAGKCSSAALRGEAVPTKPGR